MKMMQQQGKNICETLRKIRQRIADVNGISYVPRTCHHKGNCNGSCPACEEEVRYLENQLAVRRKMGIAAQVAGVALCLGALTTPATAMAQKAGGYDPNKSPISESPLLSKRAQLEHEGYLLVKGRVQDKDGKALAGAVIGTDEEPAMTVSNRQGEFVVAIPRNEILNIRAVGMMLAQLWSQRLQRDTFHTVTLYKSGEALGGIRIMTAPQGKDAKTRKTIPAPQGKDTKTRKATTAPQGKDAKTRKANGQQ